MPKTTIEVPSLIVHFFAPPMLVQVPVTVTNTLSYGSAISLMFARASPLIGVAAPLFTMAVGFISVSPLYSVIEPVTVTLSLSAGVNDELVLYMYNPLHAASAS